MHDPAGNILASHKPGEQPQLGDAKGNRLSMHGDSHFAYDALGNRIATARGKNRKLQTRYRYNGLNQLVAINNNGKQTSYQYDPLGRRIRKTSAGRKTEFLWLEDVLLSETQQDLTDDTKPSTNGTATLTLMNPAIRSFPNLTTGLKKLTIGSQAMRFRMTGMNFEHEQH